MNQGFPRLDRFPRWAIIVPLTFLGIITLGVLSFFLLRNLATPQTFPGPANPDLPGGIVLPNLLTPDITSTPLRQGNFLPLPAVQQEKNCTHTDNFWKANPGTWPTENIQIGQFFYSKAKALALLNNDATDLNSRLLSQFIVAALNNLQGADTRIIQPSLGEAYTWINANLLKTVLSEIERQQGELLVESLKEYNNGLTGPELCPDEPPTITPSPTPTPTQTAYAVNVTPVHSVRPTDDPRFFPIPTRGGRLAPTRALVSSNPPSTTTSVPPTSTRPPAASNTPAPLPTSAPVPTDTQRPTQIPPPPVTPAPTKAPTEPLPTVAPPTSAPPTEPPPTNPPPTDPPPTNPPPTDSPPTNPPPTEAPPLSHTPKPTKTPKP